MFEVTIQFLDDDSTVTVLFQESSDFSDNDIFWYGMGEEHLQHAVDTGEPVDNFKILAFEKL